MGEPEVVIGAVAHPGREGVPFLLQLAAADGVQDDPGIGRLAEPPALLFQDLRVDGAASGVAGGACRFLQGQQGIDGLLRPENVVCGAGLSHRDEFPEQVSTAQSVPGDAAVAVVGLPGVVAGDAGEGVQHPGGVHGLLAAPGMHGDQHELPRRRRVHPGELPGDPEPGLVKVRHVRPGQGLDDGSDRRGDEPGDLAGLRGQRTWGRGAAEYLAQRGARPIPGQELAVPQVGAQRRGPRPVLRRPGLRPVFFRSDFGAGLPRPSDDGGLLEFLEFCASRPLSSATSVRSVSACARKMLISVSLAWITWRSRALAARSPVTPSRAGHPRRLALILMVR